MNPPKVSVLMPNYNCEKYLPEAIESILSQSFTDFEFIIIDDGSTDKSWEIIQKYAEKDERIIAIKNKENLKICKTLNK
jgi:glycosyltransferase involved in cell wall biosynthesis